MDDSELTRDIAGTVKTHNARPDVHESTELTISYIAQMRLELHEDRRSMRLAGVTRAAILRSSVTEKDRFFLEVTEMRPNPDLWLMVGGGLSLVVTALTIQSWGLVPALLLAIVALIASASAGSLLWRPRVYRLEVPIEHWVRPGRKVEACARVFHSMRGLRGGWRETNELLLKELALSGVATRSWGRSELSSWRLLRQRNRHGA